MGGTSIALAGSAPENTRGFRETSGMVAEHCGHTVRRSVAGMICAAVVVLCAMVPGAKAEEAILVLDASRSMWGKVSKQAKHRLIHKSLTRAYDRDERGLPKIGLITYGSTAPASCTDVSVHFKPGAADREQLLEAIDGIKPWGHTPTAAALRRAAASFSSLSRKKRIVLLADGLDNCSGDPCQAALDLKADHPDLTIDVVALNVDTSLHENLSCLSTTTGGAFITASNRSEMDKAATQILDRIFDGARNSGEAPPVAALEDAEETPARGAETLALLRNPPPLPRANPKAHLRRMAQLKPKPKPAAVDLLDSEDDPETPSLPVQVVDLPDSVDVPDGLTPPPAPAKPLPSGPQEIEEDTDPIQTAAIPADQDQTTSEDTTSVPEQPVDPDASAARTEEPDKPVKPSPEHKPEFDIRDRPAEERQGLRLRAKLTATMRTIGKPVEWTVYRVEDMEQALWKQVAATRAAEPVFKLEPGTYLVRARYGHVTASKMMAVSNGKLTDATFVLNAGGIRILSHLVFVDTPHGMRATHFIYTGEADENGMRTLIAKSETQGEIIKLNAGKYRIISRLGDANSVVSTDVEVSPGVLTAVEVNHKAGVLTLKVNDPNGQAAKAKANLVVFDENGTLVTRVRGGKTTTILAPGRYTVSAEQAGRKVTTDVNIRIGEDKALNLTLK